MDGSDDGKIKVEFGDDPARTGSYTFSFQVHNLTDAPLTYALDASVLAPYVIEKDGTKYIAPNDIQVGANVSFRTDAPGFDPNGDGKLDTQDVMAILDHAVGLEPLADPAAADLNGDGAADEIDTQILSELLEGESYEGLTLQDLENRSAVTVPASGSVKVTATLSLNDEGKAYMEQNFANGNYLEGFVYLNAGADAEGRLAVSQSIPFLAFWGNWTDSSMFDTSEYARDRYSTDAHKYLGVSKENYYTVRVKGGNQYNLGVNPYAVDDAYIADRATTPPAA